MSENRSVVSAVASKGAGAAAGAAMLIALPFVSGLEGRSLIAYLDSAGVPTICDGETKGVTLGQTKTDSECDKLIAGSLGAALAVVDKYVKVPLSYHQRAGLGSFVYNAGASAFINSTALREINRYNLLAGCNSLMRWVFIRAPKGSAADIRDGKADGKKDCRIATNHCKGLVRRREREREYCLMTEDKQP